MCIKHYLELQKGRVYLQFARTTLLCGKVDADGTTK